MYLCLRKKELARPADGTVMAVKNVLSKFGMKARSGRWIRSRSRTAVCGRSENAVVM
jgi:hypothetical protein